MPLAGWGCGLNLHSSTTHVPPMQPVSANGCMGARASNLQMGSEGFSFMLGYLSWRMTSGFRALPGHVMDSCTTPQSLQLQLQPQSQSQPQPQSQPYVLSQCFFPACAPCHTAHDTLHCHVCLCAGWEIGDRMLVRVTDTLAEGEEVGGIGMVASAS